MIKARFSLHCASSKEAHILLQSLSPELTQGIPKTDIVVKQDDKTLVLKISAKDVSSLRAACNSYLRWIHTALEVSNPVNIQ